MSSSMISMRDFASVRDSVTKPDLLCRAKCIKSGDWIYGFYLEGALTAGGMIIPHALMIKGTYPVEIEAGSVCQYVEHLDCFCNDWVKAKTNSTQPEAVEGFVAFFDGSYCIEQDRDDWPVCSFSAINLSSVIKTGENTIDNPALIVR